MLDDILIHHIVVEFKRALGSEVVVDLSLSGLDDIGVLRVDSVCEGVILHADLASLHLVVQMGLVGPGGFLLVHETTRG